MDYVLRTNALTKSYKGTKALAGLTMNVPKGAIYGFVGKNGAGKTTLIRLICGLQETTRCTAEKTHKRTLQAPAAGWARSWKRPPFIWI